MPDNSPPDLTQLTEQIRAHAEQLGFQQLGIAAATPGAEEQQLEAWLDAGRHGTMDYMARHGRRRSRPAELIPGTCRVLSVRMDYLPVEARAPVTLLDQPGQAYIARYALGRDYHRVMRSRLKKLAHFIESKAGLYGYRVFVDSGPVLEKPLAQRAGLGWIGKHTNLINRSAGSWFFLGEILTDLPLPVDAPATDHCGSCQACLEVCPTQAITGPYQLDARRCISYLTIELRGSIPEEFRSAIGNRIFGCDDCQLFCPWNKFAKPTSEPDFQPRHGLDTAELIDLFALDESGWDRITSGSALRRPGYTGWLRNIAVALGNAPTTESVVTALRARAGHESVLVREHVAWALAKHVQPARD